MKEEKAAGKPLRDPPRMVRKGIFLLGILVFWSLIVTELLTMCLTVPLIVMEEADPAGLRLEGAVDLVIDTEAPLILYTSAELTASPLAAHNGSPVLPLLRVNITAVDPYLEDGYIELKPLVVGAGPAYDDLRTPIHWDTGHPASSRNLLVLPPRLLNGCTVCVSIPDASGNIAYREITVAPLARSYLPDGLPFPEFGSLSYWQFTDDALEVSVPDQPLNGTQLTMEVLDESMHPLKTVVPVPGQCVNVGGSLPVGEYTIRIRWNGEGGIGMASTFYHLSKQTPQWDNGALSLRYAGPGGLNGTLHGGRAAGHFFVGDPVHVTYSPPSFTTMGLTGHPIHVDTPVSGRSNLFGGTRPLSREALVFGFGVDVIIPGDALDELWVNVTDVWGTTHRTAVAVELVDDGAPGIRITLEGGHTMTPDGVALAGNGTVRIATTGGLGTLDTSILVGASGQPLEEIYTGGGSAVTVGTGVLSQGPHNLEVHSTLDRRPRAYFFLVSPVPPFIHRAPFSLTGAPFIVWLGLLTGVVLSSVLVMWLGEGKKLLARARGAWHLRKGPLISGDQGPVILPQVFAANLFFNGVLLVFLLVVMGTTTTTPARLGPDSPLWDQGYLFLNASVYEEMVTRFLFIGVPLFLISVLGSVIGRRKLDPRNDVVRSLFGGSGRFTRTEQLLILVSALTFSLAHVPGWDWYKAIPTFVGGLLLGYLFVKKGLHASILMHFALDTSGMALLYYQRLVPEGGLFEANPVMLLLVALGGIFLLTGFLAMIPYLGFVGGFSLHYYLQRALRELLAPLRSHYTERRLALGCATVNLLAVLAILVGSWATGIRLPSAGYVILVSAALLLSVGMAFQVARVHFLAAPLLFFGSVASLPLGMLGSISFFHSYRKLRRSLARFYRRPLAPDDVLGEE